MDFNPDTWGTVADWVGGTGTTAAFVAAVVVIAKDAMVRKIAQARKVVYVAEIKTVYRTTDAYGVTRPEEITHYVLKNLSDEPIYRVFFYAHTGAMAAEPLDSTPVILPGEAYAYELEIDEPPLACFRDNSDVGWIRNIKGKVHPYRGRPLEQDFPIYAE
ncbi:hypothetical protein NFC73_11540 [Pseudarthrobacter sp. RMG13]|uniref:Uncharacterized protein n=1 Tax=Pseudarthrobacter humi TaxID=2952523 RepID=A0ABT1LPG4_9MICC|nr:hypothetical protein [Pseudarthrobacter humi]MCP9000355.1 hypothetical protein [Pseudarthrobacter humi]